MAPRAYDDEELSISLSSSQIRRNKSNHGQAGGETNSDGGHRAPAPIAMPTGTPHHREKVRTEQRIGAYNIVKTLGEGSFGKVKLAIHRSTGQQVALKIIARKKLISRDMQGRVEREIEYLQLLRHPHIIKL
jgi:carbon catabolite-derepressing protein kinase